MRLAVCVVLGVLLVSALAHSDDDDRRARLFIVDLAVGAANINDELNADSYKELKEEYELIISDYPDHYGGYDGIANLALLNGDCTGANKYAKQALERNANPYSFKTLSICALYSKKFDEAVTYSMYALKLDESLVQDFEFMSNMTESLIHIGEYETASKYIQYLEQNVADTRKKRELLKEIEVLLEDKKM